MEFMLGCNYWASNAGADMWRTFDPIAIEKDIEVLSENGVSYLRAFPNWRDFQPIAPRFTAGGAITEYYADCQSSNEYYLDEQMLERFSFFLDVCEKHGVKLIVGLITGWMSGALFIPTALYGKNLITDPIARYFEQRFIKGFVERFKERQGIYAWDLGNECNGMAHANRYEAAEWSLTISNAIRAADSSRPIVSGMHGLTLDGNWRIEDQATATDILTTHPYPYWCHHTRIDKTLSYRTLLHATAETKLYAEIGGRPCMAEEIGTMGPMVCNDESAAKFFRVNLFSLWANGASGALWWCACEQNHLTSYPYTHKMVERELGMLNAKGEPKPVLNVLKQFDDFLKRSGITLPAPKNDAICILTRDQDHWGVGYMTYCLLRKVGLNCAFTYGDNDLPESNLYILPSINGTCVMPHAKYEALKNKVLAGADLYISLNNGILSDFEALSGNEVIDSCEVTEGGIFTLSPDISVPYSRSRNIILKPKTAEILAYDRDGVPMITVNRYGRGRIFTVFAPLEDALLHKPDAFEQNTHTVYEELFKTHISRKEIKLSNPALLYTVNQSESSLFVVVINPTETEQSFTLSGEFNCVLHYGKENTVAPYDASVIEIKR